MGGETDTIVIGAGPAGLAVGAALRARNLPFVVLERHDRVGSSWRGHYERLHLHTPKNHSALPFLDYPSSYPRYPSREQVVAYLDHYARAFDIQPHFGQDVVRCTPTAGDGWEVETQAAVTWRGRHLVVATGFNRVPCMPVQPGRDSFAGSILHSRDYFNGGSHFVASVYSSSASEIQAPRLRSTSGSMERILRDFGTRRGQRHSTRSARHTCYAVGSGRPLLAAANGGSCQRTDDSIGDR